MSIKSKIVTWWRKRHYLRQDFKVLGGSLLMRNSESSSWMSVLDGLPCSYGRTSVTTVYMDGSMDLMFVLFFRSNPLDFFSRTLVHPVLVFYDSDRGFHREDFHDLRSLHGRIGDRNFLFLMSHAAIDWRNVEIS